MPIAKAFFVGIAGSVAILLLSRTAGRLLRTHVNAHAATLVRTTILYVGLLTVVLSVLSELGFNVNTLLGAAGIAGIAIGFAAQTTMANVMSGIFIVFERSFIMGDLIVCDGVTGVVESVGILSVALRTQDGLLVRIPNENFIKNKVVNISYHAARRLEFEIAVPIETDAALVDTVLHEASRAVPDILKNPEPIVLRYGVTNTLASLNPLGAPALMMQRSLIFRLRVWVDQKKWYSVIDQLVAQIQQRSQAASLAIEIKKIES